MDFIKKLFKDEDKIIGLCGLKKNTPQTFTFSQKISTIDLFYSTNTKNNFLLS